MKTTIEEILKLLVKTYKEQHPLRTADVHPVECMCLRCLVDDAEFLLKEMEDEN